VPISVSDFNKVIAKFGFETENAHHKLAWLVHDGKKVVRTRRSHVKGRDVPAEHAILKQLHLTSPQFRGAVNCTVGRDDYLEILAQDKVI
jgi:hypothetical protein